MKMDGLAKAKRGLEGGLQPARDFSPAGFPGLQSRPARSLAKAKRGLKATLHGSTNFGVGLQLVTSTPEIFKRGYVTSELQDALPAQTPREFRGYVACWHGPSARETS